MNLLFHELIEEGRYKDRLSEVAHYRLIKQAKQQKISVGKPRLRSSISHLLETWAGWLMKLSAVLATTNLNDQTSIFTTINAGKNE